MSKIKILFTIPNFDTAGSGKVVYDLVRGLDKSKFEVEIACQHGRGGFFKEVKALGVRIHFLETTVAYRPYISLLSRLNPVIKFFKQNKYDIVHSWHWSSDWTEVLAARLAGVKWVYTKKAMSWGNRHWKIRSLMANFIVTINNEMKGYFPYKKAQKLIPIGIDTNYYKPSKVRPSEISDTFNVITVANLVPVKGIEILIYAIELMKDNSVNLKIVGDNENPYGQKIIKLCRDLKLKNQIEFVGKVKDVRPLIEEADVYIIPTLDEGRKEGMPMALVEAMCMAVPVLGSNISGINFVLNEFNNLLFPAGNSEELKEKLVTIKKMSLKERTSLGNTLRDHCIHNYSMEGFITEHELLYKSLL